MKTKITMAISLITATVLLTACGGGDSSDSNANGSTTVNGKVADGYLVGAKVCLDLNLDSYCSRDEPSDITKAGGVYSLTATSKQFATYPIVANVDVFVVDEDDNKTVAQDYTLSAVAGESFISPISTMVRGYAVEKDLSVAQARVQTAQVLGISNLELMHTDYIESGSLEANAVHEKARLIAAAKMSIATQLGDGVLSSVRFSTFSAYANKKVMEILPDIKNVVDSTVLTHEERVVVAFTALNVDSYARDFQAIKDKIEQEQIDKLTNKTFESLFSSQLIKQNQYYSKTYAGGTDFKSFEIASSQGKSCALHILDSSFDFNEYSNYSYMIDGAEMYGNYTKVQLRKRAESGNQKFTLAWMYYTSSASHVDFHITCK